RLHEDLRKIARFVKSSVSLAELWCLFGPQRARFSLIEFEHITGLNCEYIKNLDNPTVEVTYELACFWELMGVDIDAGPSSLQIIAACKK
ncbi:unnamed protein product, partial [Brassica rapa subsp. trilocularis]